MGDAREIGQEVRVENNGFSVKQTPLFLGLGCLLLWKFMFVSN